ncbi:FecR family protein [Niastella sp. OAS944]|uniref:FecR family protein n=1 Tax=Niastella sp. OAS944 TaxID=2664089 RepID=UPI0034811451|nr:ferric-dicitrate binding protein FerR (iron transport regulator) [Chitinophagaceae bacterium OAS944]
MHPSIENRFYDLLGRKLAGECQAAEQEELEAILQQHPELQVFYDQILTHTSETPEADIDAAYTAHQAKMIKPASRSSGGKRILMRALLVAASVIVVFGVTWLFLQKNNAQTIVETGTQKDSRSTMTLPDGSIVRLNAKSKVRYAEDFAKNREVYLEGEAYFEVAHNEAVPFIVHTGDADIKVLGTKFNVRNYSNEHRMEAALLTGSIELTLRIDARHKILLKPSDKIIVKKDGDAALTPAADDKKVELTSIKVQDSVIVETSWLNDKMAFVDKPFSEIALDLERQFDVHIEFKNEAVSGFKYTGVYDEDNAEDILKILQMIKPFQYAVNNKQITIY